MNSERSASDDDEEALWIVPGRDDLPDIAELPTVSPWRAPEVLRNHKDVRTKALLRAARGLSLFGLVDLKVLFWVTSHIAVPLLLLYIDEDARRVLIVASGRQYTISPANHLSWHGNVEQQSADSGAGRALRCSSPVCSERLQLLALLALTAVALGLFRSLYGSDPGFIHAGAPAVDLTLELDVDPGSNRGPAGFRPPCLQCGEMPSLRSHHDKHSGQCVHKHDHHCWFLSATVGDLNHARFVLLLAVELVLLSWLLLGRLGPLLAASSGLTGAQALRAGVHAGLAAADVALPPAQLPGWGWGRWAALWSLLLYSGVLWALVAHLAALHGYLAATGQTTLELIKGPRLAYMSRAYAALPPSQLGPGGRPRAVTDSKGCVSLVQIVRQHWRGTTPPRPFDEGLWRNLWVFFWEPKPYPYRYCCRDGSSSSSSGSVEPPTRAAASGRRTLEVW